MHVIVNGTSIKDAVVHVLTSTLDDVTVPVTHGYMSLPTELHTHDGADEKIPDSKFIELIPTPASVMDEIQLLQMASPADGVPELLI